MKKIPKNGHPKVESANPIDESAENMLVRARHSLSKALAGLDGCIDRVTETLARPDCAYDRDMASHLAWLTKLHSQITGEIRKIEAQEIKKADKLPPELVMAHLRGLPPEKRAHIVRELRAMDGFQPSVLS